MRPMRRMLRAVMGMVVLLALVQAKLVAQRPTGLPTVIPGKNLLRPEGFQSDPAAHPALPGAHPGRAQGRSQPRDLGAPSRGFEGSRASAASWQGQYWNNETLNGSPTLVRTDSAIDFDWGDGSPDPVVNRDHFSARWTATVSFEESSYRFFIYHDDGARLWIDGQLVFEYWEWSRQTDFVVIPLSAGNHQVRMEMFEKDGWAAARLWWERIGDDFGYTCDDTIPLQWIDATKGTRIDLDGDDEFAGPLPIGFPFRFYENTYQNLFVNTNGLVTFDEGTRAFSNLPIPVPGLPNDMIAVFWADLCVNLAGYNTGGIYYSFGGRAPSRYLVIEWHEVSRLGSTEHLTFQVVMHENGDIVIQYLSLSGYLYRQTVGIEDDVGADGLQYVYDGSFLSTGRAVRFSRPAVSARVKTWPFYQGHFSRSGEVVTFEQRVRNNGELGTDTYDLIVSSAWPVSLYAASGVNLVDSDLDGVPDTGPLAQGSTATIIVKISTPAWAAAGDHNTAAVTVRSSRNTSKHKVVNLQTAVPAPFAQALVDGVDGAMSLRLVHPQGEVLQKATSDWYWGYYMAVAEVPNGNFVYAWCKGRSVGQAQVWVNEIEYAILNGAGDVVRPVARLTDLSGVTIATYDSGSALAVAPDGRIGVLWYRDSWDSATSRDLYNIYFAVLDAGGNLAYGPLNLTNNTSWYQWDPPAYGAPRFYYPTVAATNDNRFVLAWTREHQAAPDGACSSYCWVTDIYYTVRSTSGSQVSAIRKLTSDTPGYADAHYYPNVASLSGNRALLTWTRGGNYGEVYYAVLSSGGDIVKPMANLVGDGTGVWDYRSDAMQLLNGRTVVAWETGSGIRYAVLNESYSRSGGPTTMENAAAVLGEQAVSVAQAGNQAVLTWMDGWPYQPNFYYALVDASGAQITPPMIFHTSQAACPDVETSYYGYGNTSYRSGPPGASPTVTPPAERAVLLPITLRGHQTSHRCDPYEPNDHYWEAYGPLAFGQSYLAYLCQGEVDDWYYFDVQQGGRITIDLAVPAVADYDLYLYSQGSWEGYGIANSASLGYGVGERIVHHIELTGRYHVRVHAYSGSSNTHPYILEVRH